MNGSLAARPPRGGRLLKFLAWLRSDLRAAVSLGFLLLLVVTSLFADQFAPFSPTQQDYNAILLPPDAVHILGTDDLGRDVFSRLIHGTKVTLGAAVLAVTVACVIGLPLGLTAGFFGGWFDDLVSRVIDTLLSFPAIVLAVGVTGALGIGLVNSMTAMGIVFSPLLARLIRAQTLIVKGELYVDAARCFGASPMRLILKHVLPNAIQPVIVQVTLLLAAALLAESGLSFLGLGVQPPHPSWGAMLAKAFIYMEISPEQMYAPGFAILLTALAFNALGESMRIALDPTMKS